MGKSTSFIGHCALIVSLQTHTHTHTHRHTHTQRLSTHTHTHKHTHKHTHSASAHTHTHAHTCTMRQIRYRFLINSQQKIHTRDFIAHMLSDAKIRIPMSHSLFPLLFLFPSLPPFFFPTALLLHLTSPHPSLSLSLSLSVSGYLQ